MKLVLLLSFAVILISSCSEGKKKRVLPFIGNYDIEYKLVDGKEVADTVFPRVPDFTYLNHDSLEVTAKSFKGKIWIADFFFTTCPTICPVMTRNLKELHDRTLDIKDQLQFLSFSVNPNFDQPIVLKRYRAHYGISSDHWDFLTGDEAATHELGIEHFQIFAGRDEEAEGGFAHSGAFTLVDKEGYVRGVYLGTDKKQVRQLELDLRKLLKEEYGIAGSK
jgi:protein SCO1/2